MHIGKDGTRATTSLRPSRSRAMISCRAPVGDPDAAVVPARRLGEREAPQQDLRVNHGHLVNRRRDGAKVIARGCGRAETLGKRDVLAQERA